MSKTYTYNGKLIRDMSDEELLNELAAILALNLPAPVGARRAFKDQILLRMNARKNVMEQLYVCEECGVMYCYSCQKGLGATEPTKIEPGFCGQECRDAHNAKADPPEKHYPAPGQGTVAAITGTRF